MYTLGIDVGSSSSKAVILEDGKKIIAQAVVEIGTGSSGPERVLDEVFEKTNLKIEDMANIIATGYGRFNVDCAKGEVSEITCHGGLVLQIEASCRCQQYLHGLCRIGSHFPFVEEHPERRHRSRCPSVHCR